MNHEDGGRVMKIHKYPLEINDVSTVHLPAGAQVLAVQIQSGKPCLWALVDPEADTETRLFTTRGTGKPLSEPIGDYVATYHLEGYVGHVFETTGTEGEKVSR